jgi:hypothetical protein
VKFAPKPKFYLKTISSIVVLIFCTTLATPFAEAGTKTVLSKATKNLSKENDPCQILPNAFSWEIGLTAAQEYAVLGCWGGKLVVQNGFHTPVLNPKTGLPIAAPLVKKVPVFTDECQADPLVPAEWASTQLWSILNMACAYPYRYVAGNSNFKSPKTVLTDNSKYLNIDKCKMNDTGANAHPVFPYPADRFQAGRLGMIQVIPLEFPDFPTPTTPTRDYGKYFDFGRDYLKNVSDVPINPEYRVPLNYIKMPHSFSDYSLSERVDINNNFYRDVVAQVGASIDFTGVFQVLFVLSPTTPRTWNTQAFTDSANPLKFLKGSVSSFYLMGSSSPLNKLNGNNLSEPMLMIHEEFGHGSGLDDEYGKEPGGGNLLHDPNSGVGWTSEELGMGLWGAMSMWHTEFLVWDKWILNFVGDAQIACLPSTSSSTVWLRPSTTKGTFLKAAVIPLSQTRAIVVESERSTGYNFKLPKKMNGALVYTIDVTKTSGGSNHKSGLGFELLRPSSRTTPPVDDKGFIYGDATLKSGESVTISGVTVKNVENGDFGDVIQISPTN